jgi:hypothetical protein
MKPLKMAVIVFLSLVLLGCGLSNQEIADIVKKSMQDTLKNDGKFKQYDMTVEDVQILKQSEQYKGIAKIRYDADTYNVGVNVSVDGSQVMWEAPPGSFMFVFQNEYQKQMDEIDKQTKASQAEWDKQQADIDREYEQTMKVIQKLQEQYSK